MRPFAAILVLVAAPAAAQIAQTPVDGVDLFETRVRPLLQRNCFKCHGNDPERLQGELELNSRVGLLRGGAHGPALDVQQPDASLILQAVAYDLEELQMPPDGRLDDAEVDLLRQWIRVGAPYGGDNDQLTSVAGVGFQITDRDREWWSVQPLSRPAAPAVANQGWPANELDRFILARLEAANLVPAQTADRRTLIRRATYDLTGLPPSAAQVEAFERDSRPDAWQRLIDRLLASPHYGERWGRHWLDLVRYAETDGYERDRTKPGAWRYRDWVIRALNADMPYDEFLVHQLAGDEIVEPTADSIIATGYLRLGIWDDEPTDVSLAQFDDLDSILDTTSRVMLGASMGCARCHNHRGDPIPQRDYYRMLSFFRGLAPYKTEEGVRNAPTFPNYVDYIPAESDSSAHDAALDAWRHRRAELHAELVALIGEAAHKRGEGALAQATAERDRDLVAHLALEESRSLVAIDSTGRFHGRIGDATVGAEGVDGRAFTFDGDDDAIQIARPVADDFTLSIWFRTAARAKGHPFSPFGESSKLFDTVGDGPGRFGLGVAGKGWIRGMVAGSPIPKYVRSGPGYNDGAWHHVALTRDQAPGAIRLFVDGELLDEREGSTTALESPELIEIGRGFAGELDEARIYDRALSRREIADLALGGALAAPFEELVARTGKKRLARYREVAGALLALERPRRETLEVLRAMDVGREAPKTHILIRGNPHAPADQVEPGFPEILDPTPAVLPTPGPDATSTGRRLALARWIASPANIRTSRVMANRLWQFHFGRGLVPTPNDFGKFGREPTHPRLLDWLADEFVAHDWSLKAMHRLIMTSRVYRMSSRGRPEALAQDPENHLFWRFDMRRLAAEEIRDSILAASGTLNLEVGGPSVYPPIPEEVLATASRPDQAWGEATPEEAARRSVYIHIKRSLLHPMLETLDFADTDATCPVRFVTTQPTQALTMINGEFMNEQAALLAERASHEAGPSLEGRVGKALEIVLSREPEPQEIASGIDLIEDLETEEGLPPEKAFASFSLVLLNLNEFVYVD